MIEYDALSNNLQSWINNRRKVLSLKSFSTVEEAQSYLDNFRFIRSQEDNLKSEDLMKLQLLSDRLQLEPSVIQLDEVCS